MGNLQSSIRKTNFEDVQYAINNPNSFILINTLNNKLSQLDDNIKTY